MSDHESFEDWLRAIADEISRSVQRMSEFDVEDLSHRYGVDADRARAFADAAGRWLNDRFSASDPQFGHIEHPDDDSAARPPGADLDLEGRPEAKQTQPPGPGPHPLDLATDQQGISLSALDSGRWTVRPGSNQLAGTGTGMERDYDYTTAIWAEDMLDPQAIGKSAGERAVKRLNPRKVETRRVPVVFDPRISGSLIGHLANAANGAAIARKTSFLRNKLGERLFRPDIAVIDDPLRKRGLRSRPFDAEGVATRELKLIEDGVLKSWLLDCATARELHLQTTAHAHRGVSSVPSPGPSNLYLAPGPQTPEALIADVKDGFYVTDLIGAGINLVTGDYSRGAAGFWIVDGTPTYPVSEITIAGHLSEMFANLQPANDLVFRYATNAPTVRVEGLTVAGH